MKNEINKSLASEVKQCIIGFNLRLKESEANLDSLNILGVRHERDLTTLIRLYLLAQVQLFALLLAVIVLVNN
jgi:hypothetical protein